MPLLHDHDHRRTLLSRMQTLTPDSERRWGTMTVDQMLWHVNGALEVALARRHAQSMKLPIPKPMVRFIILTLPWGKNAPTMPEIIASGQYEFDAERGRAFALIDEFATRDLQGPWPEHPAFGKMTGRQVSKLHARHVDHHLRQFGA